MAGLPITSRTFRSPAELGAWLAEHRATAKELWVEIFKVGSGTPSVTWTECVVEALRFGWIDGQKRSLGASSFLQRLTPRQKRSGWSARNREHVDRLVTEGRMMPSGLAQVEAAKADRGWGAAYAGATTPGPFGPTAVAGWTFWPRALTGRDHTVPPEMSRRPARVSFASGHESPLAASGYSNCSGG